MKTIDKLNSVIAKCLDRSDLQDLYTKLNLIQTVDTNYQHISELESLANLFRKPGSNYDIEYQPVILLIDEVCREIAKNTYYNHYNGEKPFSVYEAIVMVKNHLLAV